jgi:hypothetical protein
MPSRKSPPVLTKSRLRNRLLEPVGTSYPDPPDLLYHYTTHSGLAGIVNSKKLWATNLQFSNDASEMEDGKRIFERAIDDADRRGLLDEVREPFAHWYMNGPEDAIAAGIFGVCFSEKGDDLSQWRAYAPTGGYSLGFSGNELQLMHDRGIATLDKVIYDPIRKAEIATGTVEAALAAWQEIQAGAAATKEKRVTMFRETLEWVVRHCICIMKDASFLAESEWRLFVQSYDLDGKEPVKYRAGASSLVPYAEIPIAIRGRRILRHAIVGPSPHQDLALGGLTRALWDRGFGDVGADTSDIPFRL